jgi:hypothetical protein
MLFVSYAVFLGALGFLLGRAATKGKEPSPLLALLAFALVPISSIRAPEAPDRRSVPA